MFNETIQTLHSLRSVRIFDQGKHISEADMQTILEASVRAATASHRQSYAIIDIDDRDVIHKTFGNSGDRALLYCIDIDRAEQLANRLGAVFENKGMMEYHSGIIDTVLAAQNAVVAARSLGIDSVIHHSLQVKDMDAFYEQFALPKHKVFPVLTIVLGYAQEEPAFQKGRLTAEGIVHHNTYKPFDEDALDRIIARYDVKEDHMGYIANWEEKGYAHYLAWFYDVWNNAGTLDEASRMMLKTLEETDFLNPSLLD